MAGDGDDTAGPRPADTPAHDGGTTSPAWRDRVPPGAIAMATGTIGAAAGGLVFLIIADRNLAPDTYSAFTLAWLLMFAVTGGILGPLEQELSRASRLRIEQGLGVGPLVRHYSWIAGLIALTASTLALATYPFLGRDLFNDEFAAVAGLVGGICGQAVFTICRAMHTATSRFSRFGAMLIAESALRLAGILVAIAIVTTGSLLPALVVLLGFPPLVLGVGFLVVIRNDLRGGPPAPRRALTVLLGWTVWFAGLATFIAVGGAIIVALLDGGADAALPGTFFNAQTITRMPLLPGQALIVAALLQITSMYARNDFQGFRASVRRGVLASAAVGVAGVVGTAIAGPWLLDLLFEPQTQISRLDLTLLAVGTLGVLVASATSVPLMSIQAHREVAIAVTAGAVVGGGFVLFSPLGAVPTAILAAPLAALVWGLVARRALRGIPAYQENAPPRPA